jgi:hypothetical protein
MDWNGWSQIDENKGGRTRSDLSVRSVLGDEQPRRTRVTLIVIFNVQNYFNL